MEQKRLLTYWKKELWDWEHCMDLMVKSSFLDGVAYQGRSDGSVVQLDGSELTPMQQLQILRQILVFLF